MLSYTTELPVIIYRTEIICRRYKSTLKCSQSPHRQYGATQHRNHMLPHSFPHQYGRRTDEHMGRCDLVLFLRAKKANVPTLGPKFLVKFPRVGKAMRSNTPHMPVVVPLPGLNIDRWINGVCQEYH